MSGAASAASASATTRARPVRVQRLRTTRWRMSSAGLGITTTLLGGAPSGQAAGHADMAFKRMRSPALFRREPLDLLIHRLVGDATFQDLHHPLIVNTVDVNSGMQVFWGLEGLDEAPVKDAVFASCAIPGFLPPREIRGRFYVDGATVDNLPVGTARILGADVILAVDVSASNAFRADTQEDGFSAVFARATEIAMQSLLELRMREWTTPPIYYIHPR